MTGPTHNGVFDIALSQESAGNYPDGRLKMGN